VSTAVALEPPGVPMHMIQIRGNVVVTYSSRVLSPARVAPVVVAALVGLIGCSGAAAQSRPLEGTSTTVIVKGQYSSLALDRVDTVSMKDGRLVVSGPLASVALTLPAGTDATKPVRHWALVTEANVDDRRTLTFTHDQSLDDFTLELPPTEARVHYGVFEGLEGAEVMVLTWGADAKCYWGYVTIVHPPAPGR
jgi:hypothetical protein